MTKQKKTPGSTLEHIAALGEAGAIQARERDAGFLEGFRQLFRANGAVLDTAPAAPVGPEAWSDLAAITLDLSRPSAHAREIAGLTPAQAREALGLPNTPGGQSTFWSPERYEREGRSPTLSKLIARCAAYGLELRIQVRRKP